MDIGKVIAVNLKALRQERGLTLGQLSKLSEISKGMLSEMEKGESNPTINTIWKLANGLGVPYTRLLEEPETASTRIRRGDIAVQRDEQTHYRIYCYFKNTPSRNFEFFYVELDAQSSKVTSGHTGKSEEYIYVISGELILETDTESWKLQSGDALTFDASTRHNYVNQSKDMAAFVVVNFYPNL